MAILNNENIVMDTDVRKWFEKLKYLCKFDLFTFANVVLGYKLLQRNVHEPFCSFLTDSFLDAVVFPQMSADGLPLPKKPIYHPKSMRRRKKILM